MVMLKIGVCGFSEGNGHPFSFSAILNGYSDEGFEASGWSVIHEYIRERDGTEIGTLGARVTHVWTPDPDLSRSIATATHIESVVLDPRNMIGDVDAVMILRDDHESHLELAAPFLEAGLPLFVDKPLALNEGNLREFVPALEAGKLFSVSGLRFARELDSVRVDILRGKKPLLFRAAVVNDWVRYGVHMVDVLFGITAARPLAVTALPSRHESFAVELEDGALFQVDCVGPGAKIFRFDVIGREGAVSVDIGDNFTAFRRTLAHFIDMAVSGKPPISPEDTVMAMLTLLAGCRSQAEGRRVELVELDLG